MAEDVAELSGARHQARAAQVAWALLHTSTANALQYDYTLCPAEALARQQAELRRALKKATERIAMKEMTANEWRQATLPGHLGGLSLRAGTQQEADAAYWATWVRGRAGVRATA